MNGERRQVLQMLADGKVSADEAERLLNALETDPAASVAVQEPESRPPARGFRYLRVMVEAEEDGGPVKVNVRVPIQLLRAGVKLVSVIPPQAQEHVNDAMRRNGMPFDLTQIKPENLDEIIDQLRDLTVDIDQQGDHGGEKAKVRVFCE
jgi:hypothetical protein